MSELKGCLKDETRSKVGKRANNRETSVEMLIMPELVSRWTGEIPCIVRLGFLMPKEAKDIRCGSTYGKSFVAYVS